MLARLVLLLSLGAALSAPAPASASTADEERAGQALARELQSGAKRCERLTRGELERLGEFVMGRMVGSGARHAAIHERMRSALGAAGERRMHVVTGRRYSGCAAASGGESMMGPGAMDGGGWGATGTWGPMMGSERWDWMRDGMWEDMNHAEWRGVAARWMGPGAMAVPADDGWGGRELALVGGGLVLLAALVAALVMWRPRFRRPAV